MSFQICGIRVCRVSTVTLLLGLAIMAPTASAQVASVVRLLSTPPTLVLGQNDTIAAGVNWTGGPAPSGTITVIDTVLCPGAATSTVALLGTITLGSATSAAPGAGTLVTSAFPCVGGNLIVAEYGGDSNYSPGASQPLLETVLGQFTPTTTTLSSSLNPSTVGQDVTFAAQVKYALTYNTHPTGTVTFTDTNKGAVLGTGNVQTSGTGVLQVTGASIATSSLAAGSYAIQAAYSGDSIYAPSTSQIVTQVLTSGSAPPSIQAGGVVTLSQFGDFTSVAPGAFIEIHGSNLAANTRSWASSDFQGANAPTSLDKTSVSIGGQAAFIAYISPGQVNAQVPSSVATGSQPLIVTTPAGSSAAYTVTVNQTQPGLLAPSSFVIGGKQYVGALFPDGVTFVLPPGAISGVGSQRAKPGDVITLYGIGFGSVTPDTPAGQIVQQSNTLAASFQISFGGVPAVLQYWGLAPQCVGLYQFNVVVPNLAASDTVPLTFALDGVGGAQTLYIAVQN